MKLVPNKLCIVAHPDDEVLWGGANLLAEPGWKVIVATNRDHPKRRMEFYKTMEWVGVWEPLMFNCKDTDDEDDTSLSNSAFERELRRDSKKKWKLVLAHNESGEYGHPQHMYVSTLVKTHFPDAKFFGVSSLLPPRLLSLKRKSMQYYAATQNISKMIYQGKSNELRPREYNHYAKETLYLKPKISGVPKIIHQIWIGGTMPLYKKRLTESVKRWCNRNGWIYKLWGNDVVNDRMLPFTFSYIQKAKKYGRWAQMADFMRLELIVRYGGYYLDTNMSIINTKNFLEMADNVEKKNVQLVVANEDPCSMTKCKYMSNGFFGSTPGSHTLRSSVNPSSLTKIDMSNPWINRTTGPYYFYKHISDKDTLRQLDTNSVYPFNANENAYRPKEQNKCVNLRKGIHITTFDPKKRLFLTLPCRKYSRRRNAMLMNHFLGGSWDPTA